jgi:hypothetical protein
MRSPPRIADLVSFYPEKVTVTIDGGIQLFEHATSARPRA